jgi:hypothetical protein
LPRCRGECAAASEAPWRPAGHRSPGVGVGGAHRLRTGEMLGMQWPEVACALAAERCRAEGAEPHVVYLSPRAVAILESAQGWMSALVPQHRAARQAAFQHGHDHGATQAGHR